jgi:hypothetical protein
MHPLRYIAFTFILIYVSCENPFAPSLAPENTPTSRLLTPQRTPEEVLSNFRYAYTYKDSLTYSEVLDSTFIFRSTDYNEYPPMPIEWGRDIELRTTARMFRYFNTLDVVWNTISPADTVSPPDTSANFEGYIIEHDITFTLTLDGGKAVPPLNGEVLFQFIQRGEKYYISFWQDLKI